jgi:hypothetical protein
LRWGGHRLGRGGNRRLGTGIELRRHERGNQRADADHCQQQLSAARGNKRHLNASGLKTATHRRSRE